MIIFVLLQKLLSPSVFPQMEWKSDILQSNCNCKSHLWGNVGGWGRRSNGDHLCPQKTERFHYFGKTTQVDQPSAFTCFSYYLHFFPKTISMSCGNGNKPLDMWIYLVITSWISWTNNQRSRLLVMIRLWWCFPGARNWLMSAAFRNGGAFSFLPPLPPASVKLSPSICYYPQQHFFTPFWDIFDTFFVCMLNTSANAGQTVEMSITCCLNTESAPTWQTHHSDYPRREKRKSNNLFLRVSCCSQSLRWGGSD